MTAITEFKRRLPAFRSGLSQFRRWATNTSANISILAGLTFIPLTIAVTAAVDLSNAIRIKGSLQAAADAGVLAAATALASGYGDTDKEKIAKDTFFANISPQLMSAFPTDPEVTINFDTGTVQMNVSVNTDQLLTNLITDSISIGVQATAVADQGSPVCLMSLNPTLGRSLHIQGTADVNAIACAVQVNSSHAEAMRQIGSSKAVAESYCVHGDYTGSNYTPMPRRHCMRQQDPLAEKFAIDLAGENLGPSPCKGDINKLVGNGEKAHSINPGIYCEGLEIKGEVTLKSGVHVFLDHGLYITAGGSLTLDDPVNGGVILLMAGPQSRFANQAGANINVTAMRSGPFAGIVLASHPDTVPPSNKKNTIIGGGQMEFNGIVYFPTQEIKITGNGDIGADSAQFAIMADMIDIDGNGTLFIHISADAADAGLPGLPTTNEIIRLVK
jgi:Flp pilus assembly protein TadG